MRKTLTRFATDESGATAIEYGLIAGGICIAIGAVVKLLGGSVTGLYTAVAASF